MSALLWVGTGGFIGAILRYLVSGGVQGGMTHFPFGTLSVNFIGSFFLGTLMFLGEYKGILTEEARLFLCVGMLGAFTTMSTFGYETLRLMDQGQWGLMATNIFGSVALALFGVYLGKILALQF